MCRVFKKVYTISVRYVFSSIKIQSRIIFFGILIIAISGGSLWFINYKAIQMLTEQSNFFATVIDPTSDSILSVRAYSEEEVRAIEEFASGFDSAEDARKKIEVDDSALQGDIQQIKKVGVGAQLISKEDLKTITDLVVSEKKIAEEVLGSSTGFFGGIGNGASSADKKIISEQMHENLVELDKVEAGVDDITERLSDVIITKKRTSSEESARIGNVVTRVSGGLTVLIVFITALFIIRLTKRLKESYARLEGENVVLLASEQKFKDLVESITDLVWEFDTGGMLTYGNPKTKDILGYEISEFLGKNFRDFIPEEDREKMEKVVREVMEQKKMVLGVEVGALHKDGHRIELEVDILPLFDAKGNIRGFRGIVRDITERKKGEVRIKELNDLRSRFIQIISHQLRTPLGSMRWSIETLLEEKLGPLTDGQKEFVHMIYDADVSVLTRVNDLLVIMDIEEGRIAIQKEKISIDSLLASVVGEFIKKAQVKKINFSWHGPEELLPALLVDSNKMRQVFEKLIENAVIHTPDGGTIIAKLVRLGDRIRFEITDTGVGIPAVEQKNIFKSFFRASNAFLIRPDASGVGLAIAKYFVEQHAGTIGFTSEEGKGSTFWFEIPIMEQ